MSSLGTLGRILRSLEPNAGPTSPARSGAHPDNLPDAERPRRRRAAQPARRTPPRALGQAWIARPPCKERRYRRLDDPIPGLSGRDIKPNEALSETDVREGWEVAHLPGMHGPVRARQLPHLFFFFFRDKLRGIEQAAVAQGVEEWRRVVPLDKDLRRYLVWRWQKDGWDWDWDMCTGNKKRIAGHGDGP